jgi:hypothetical protein
MKHLLSVTSFIAVLAVAAPVFAAAPLRPLGGPYTPETAPSPPSTIYEGPAYYGYYGRGYYPYYGGGYYRYRYGYYRYRYGY